MSEERIITAETIIKGEKTDGKELQTLIEKRKAAGMGVKTVIGDTAYSERDNIAYSTEHEIEFVARLNPMITQGNRKKEDEFEFYKDAGMYVCKAGHLAIRRARQGKKGQGKNQTIPTISILKSASDARCRKVATKKVPKAKRY